jgi:hypothetical protein
MMTRPKPTTLPNPGGTPTPYSDHSALGVGHVSQAHAKQAHAMQAAGRPLGEIAGWLTAAGVTVPHYALRTLQVTGWSEAEVAALLAAQ